MINYYIVCLHYLKKMILGFIHFKNVCVLLKGDKIALLKRYVRPEMDAVHTQAQTVISQSYLKAVCTLFQATKQRDCFFSRKTYDSQ